jgi:sensor domain CHASE-containing protein
MVLPDHEPRRDVATAFVLACVEMSLYTKVTVLLCALFATYGAIDYTVQRRVILPSFEALEADLARTDIERVTRALDGELAQLLTFCGDWGNWLETYEYMAGDNPAFIADNMTPATIAAVGLDVVAYLDADSRYVWRRGYDPVTHTEQPYEMLAGDALPESHPFRDPIANGQPASGLVLTEHGPALLVAAPILDGAGNGPHRGAVLLARILTPTVAARLAEQAQVALQLSSLPQAGFAAPVRDMLLDTRIVRHEDANAVFRGLADIFGRPAVTLRVDVPRSVSAQGRDAVGFASLSLFLAGVSVLLVLGLAMRRMILGPVSHMTKFAVALGESDDLTRRMNVERRDELGILAREFDRMVDKLAEARRRLVDQSFEAGAAQVASGVLHNVGNAMTPLGVAVADLQERLRAAPVGELEMVIGELDSGTSPAARRKDLEEFLRLACRELARVVVNAASEADVVARQAEAIQRALAQQLHAAQTGPVRETAHPVDVVHYGIEMVAPALRQRLAVEIDPALRDIGAVTIPRITLQQVVQNLVQNAAEAVRDAGRPRGLLRISGGIVRGETSPELVLRFTDDGDGIPPEYLSRIFESGFSTKSRATNFGIGLHWCANALNALGGRMRAESPGLGRGATLEVALPLPQALPAARAA